MVMVARAGGLVHLEWRADLAERSAWRGEGDHGLADSLRKDAERGAGIPADSGGAWVPRLFAPRALGRGVGAPGPAMRAAAGLAGAVALVCPTTRFGLAYFLYGG